MSRPNFDVIEVKLGNGTLDEYTFNFKITNINHLLVIKKDVAGDVVFEARGSDTMWIDNVTFDSINGGGRVFLPSILENNEILILLLADDAPTQPSRFRNKGDFTLRNIEEALDYQNGQIQRLAYLMGRTMRFADSNEDQDTKLLIGETPDDETFPMWTPQGVVWISRDSLTGGTGAQVPPGGVAGSVFTKVTDDDGDTEWNPFGYSGHSNRFGQSIDTANLDETLRWILNLGYLGPAVSLATNPANSLREKGVVVNPSVLLTANVQRRLNDISAVNFFKDGVLIHSVPVPNPAGGIVTHTWVGSFSDNTNFRVEVTDIAGNGGGPTTVGQTQSFPFEYPHFWGRDPSSTLTPAQVAATLTKDVRFPATSISRAYPAQNNDYLYFAQPASLPPLTQIFDVTNFPTILGWTMTVGNYTANDGTTQSLRVYRLNNPVAANTINYRFER